MATETNTTKTKTTSKRTTATKAASQKTSNTKTKTEETKEIKKFELDDMIYCQSVRHGTLTHIDTNGIEYDWYGFGDIQMLPYKEIISLKSRKSKFLYEPWILIKDEDLMAREDFQKDFADMYAAYDKFDYTDPKEFFEQDISTIRKELKEAPNGLRDYIKWAANQYIKDGVLDRISVIRVIDEVYGTRLTDLM